MLSEDFNQLEKIAIKFRDKILNELSKIDELDTSDSGSTETQLKSYNGFFKLLQSLEEMIKKIEQERDKKSERGVDILEFRRKLEEQIANLVDAETKGVISK